MQIASRYKISVDIILFGKYSNRIQVQALFLLLIFPTNIAFWGVRILHSLPVVEFVKRWMSSRNQSHRIKKTFNYWGIIESC